MNVSINVAKNLVIEQQVTEHLRQLMTFMIFDNIYRKDKIILFI